MSTTLDPREVDKPFLRRWSRMSFELVMRSPVRFGIVIAVLGWFDTSALTLAQGFVVQKVWIDRIGMFFLPVLWTFISALARGADDASRAWEALAGLRRKRVWGGAFATGATMATLNWIIAWAFHGMAELLSATKPRPYLQHPGQFLDSLAANVMLTCVFVGLCYFPLLVLVPEISSGDARYLSRKASDINGANVIWCFVGAMVVGADILASVVPAYGMTTAVFLVFMGTFNYVAYRDIFERRSGNLPKAVVVPHVSGWRSSTRSATPLRVVHVAEAWNDDLAGTIPARTQLIHNVRGNAVGQQLARIFHDVPQPGNCCEAIVRRAHRRHFTQV